MNVACGKNSEHHLLVNIKSTDSGLASAISRLTTARLGQGSISLRYKELLKKIHQ